MRTHTRHFLFAFLYFCIFAASIYAQNEGVRIEGTLLMFDDKTPHVAVVVQAVTPLFDGRGEPTVVATTLSSKTGKYQFVNLKPGRYQVRCHTLNGYVYYREVENSAVAGSHAKTLYLKPGRTLSGIDFRFAPFKKGRWKNYTVLDGLVNNSVRVIHRAPDGVMWFGTHGGISRYDGTEFVNLLARFDSRTTCAMCIATLDCDNRILRYANAGIPYPVLKRSEKIDELQSNGLPLGGLAQAEYEETPPRALEAGDVLVFFTDGITEAQSKNNTDRYYIEAPRLQTLAGGFNSEMKAGAMIDEIFADVGKFSGVTHQNDDMTIVVVKVL